MSEAFESYLEKDRRLDFKQFGDIPEEPSNEPSQSLTNSIKHINSSLNSYGFPPTGNLFSNDSAEVSQTVNCIYAMLRQRHRDVGFRSEIYDKLNRVENERSKLQQQVERLAEQKSNLENEVSKFQNQIKQINSKNKAEKDKLLTERDELKRENNRLSHKETQFLHELKKKDSGYSKLQEQLRKSLGEKEVAVRNQAELVSPLHTEGALLFKNADSEFSYMISRGYEENQNALLIENQELRSAFEMLQNELQEMMKQRREAFQKRYGEQLGELTPDFKEFTMEPVKTEVFGLPFQGVSENVVKTFQENLRVFRNFMDKADEAALEIEGDEGTPKVKSIQDLQELLSKSYLENYRALIKNQESLMQNAILGSRNIATDHVGSSAARLQVTSDQEIEKANRFLQEEFTKLESKQQEIEEQRHNVTENSKKLEEERLEVTVRLT